MSPLRSILRSAGSRKPEGRASSENNNALTAMINGVVFELELATTQHEGEYPVEQVPQRNGRWKAFFYGKTRKRGRQEDTTFNQIIRERKAAEKAYKRQVRELDCLGAYLFKKMGPIGTHPQYQMKLEYVRKAKERFKNSVEEEKALRNGLVL